MASSSRFRATRRKYLSESFWREENWDPTAAENGREDTPERNPAP